MRYRTRPLTVEARSRLNGVQPVRSPFGARWEHTLNQLDTEMRALGVHDEFVLQVDVTAQDLRLDGELRADARPATAAVAIAIDTRHRGPLLFVCGRFDRWQDNVRAITLGLEALRRVDRYGITQAAEQYRGFSALPPGTPMPAARMSIDAAAQFLIDHGETDGCTEPADLSVLTDDTDPLHDQLIAEYYRRAAKRLHPDSGGDPALFRQLTDARKILTGALA